jgi:PAS domain-containing protein
MTDPTFFFAIEKPDWLAQMETVLEVLNKGVVITDDSQQILFANSRFSEMTGFDAKSSSDFALRDSIHRRNGTFLHNK